jgi:hypothetical protein
MRRGDTDDGAILVFPLISPPNRSYKALLKQRKFRERERDAACGTTQLLHVATMYRKSDKYLIFILFLQF